MDQQFGQVLVGRRVVGLGEENGHVVRAKQRYPEEVGHLLAPLARSVAELEMQKVATSAGGRVQQRQPKKRGGHLAVTEQRKETLADRWRTLLAPLPVRVLVAEGRVDLVKVVTIRVTHVCAQDTIPPGLVQTVLQSRRMDRWNFYSTIFRVQKVSWQSFENLWQRRVLRATNDAHMELY